MAIRDDPSVLNGNPPAQLAWLRDAVRDSPQRRRAASLGIAIFLEVLIVLLLLTLGTQIAGERDAKPTVTEFTAIDVTAPEAEPEPESESQATLPEPQPQSQPVPDQPLPQPAPLRPSPLTLNPLPAAPPPPAPPQAEPEPAPQPSPSPTIAARIRPGRNYGPADTGDPRTANDSQPVGTAPNGEPLYAARWYREPTDQELKGYLSTATAPSYALIACKVVTGYYVEDCELLSEGPTGSQIGRAVMAASWQFRVRPARLGGREQFGTWVRIRIDYTARQAR